MSSPVQDLSLEATTPNVVPASPPQTTQNEEQPKSKQQQQQQQRVWYPTPHQQHYTIVMGNNSNNSNNSNKQPKQQYIIKEQQQEQDDKNRSSAVTTPTIQEAPFMLSAISPLQTNTPRNAEDDEDDEEEGSLLLLPLQRSPPNANHIFRPRPTRKRSNRDTTRKRNGDAETRQEDCHNSRNDNDDSLPLSSPWEPIPWSNIFLTAGNTMDEDDYQDDSFMTTTNQQAPVLPQEYNTPHSPYAPLLLPRLQQEHHNQQQQQHDNHCQYHGAASSSWLAPSLPLPPSPVVRRRHSMPTNNSKSKRFVKRKPSASPATTPAPASKRPRLTATPPPPPPSSGTTPLPSWWPKTKDGNDKDGDDGLLLQGFWHYCTAARPHLLPTLTSAVKACQKQQTKDVNEKPLVVQAIMDELVSAWGAPLFGEVRRQVLAQQHQQQQQVQMVSRSTTPTRPSSTKGSTAEMYNAPPPNAMSLAVAYGFHLARLQANSERDLPPSGSMWDEAAQHLETLSTRDRQRLWQDLTQGHGGGAL